MSDQQIEDMSMLVEGLVYGKLVDAGVDQRRAIRISNHAATRLKDMVKSVSA